MASNPQGTIGAGKGVNTPKATSSPSQQSPAQSQTGSVSGGDYGQLRSGRFGSGTPSRSTPSPRNGQASRKQHKGSKRLGRAVDEDALAETRAMRSANSRKGQTSITHLMRFSLPPRPDQHLSYLPRNGRRAPTWGPGSGYHAIDKARYVHANYRFIVDPKGDYHAQGVDADVYLDWSNVLQILASSKSQTASCPICLGVPVAPRMAKCGHMFCLPCLIRYMHSNGEKQHVPERRTRCKACPVCGDSIFISETRPVRWYEGQEGEPLREGGDVVLRLVKREAGSTLALPRDGATALGKDEDVPWYFAADVMDYARIMKGTEDYMLEQFDNDIEVVRLQEKEDELMFGEDVAEWANKAVRMIHEAKDKVKGMGGPPPPTKPVEQAPKRPPIQFSDASDVPEMYGLQHAAKSGQSIGTFVPASTDTTPGSDAAQPGSQLPPAHPSPFGKRRLSNTHTHNQAPSEYYFYQALLHYYLSPLDIRILREAFGSFASFPSTILPRIEHISTGHIVDDDLRKRTRYLAHLPYGCEVSFLECDWTDTVPPEILARFQPEIERRRARNADKESREEKARLRAEREEDDKRYAHLRRRRDEKSPLSQEDFAPLRPAAEDAESGSPPLGARQGSAFASLADISTSPSAQRTVWGTPVVPGSGSPLLGAQAAEPVPGDDGWLQGWEKDLLQEDEALVEQAKALSVAESSKAGAAAGGGGGGGGGKKKKKMKITLMSTNVRRGA
ncbi:hypothetical protein EJ06DRAFT_549160 [Trichodelitschia bisporula]|uniref:RING-type domain-containing protein n=1 Tax=Trichodelitschia bisporula TaxID=703511 RepID=A0A6G1HXM1_9PEZI|nr:hypothetical protein EJ06DRAFT_549160 [Trichodelitschia bisporula]